MAPPQNWDADLEPSHDDVDLPPCGSWDFPMSRGEKMRRLIMVFEAELERSQREEFKWRKECEELRRKPLALSAITAISPRSGSNEEMQSDAGIPPITPNNCQDTTSCMKPAAQRASLAPPPAVQRTRRRTSMLMQPTDSEDEGKASKTIPHAGVDVDDDADDDDESMSPSNVTAVRMPSLGATSSLGVSSQSQAWPVSYKSLPRAGGTLMGSVAVVVYGGTDKVSWLRFIPRAELGAQNVEPASPTSLAKRSWPGCENLDVTGELILKTDEYVKIIRGRSTSDGHAADWLTIITSDFRTANFGPGGKGSSQLPTFSFLAAPGHEITSVTTGPDACIEGANESPLQLVCNDEFTFH